MFDVLTKSQATRIMNYGADLGAIYLEAPALAVRFVSHFSKKNQPSVFTNRHEIAKSLLANSGLTLDDKQVASLFHVLDASLS